jgi:hypothetical protein
MNQNLVITSDTGDVSTSTLVNNLPGGTGSFTPTYQSENNFANYYLEVYNQRNVGDSLPYRYGSYQIYSANIESQIY